MRLKFLVFPAILLLVFIACSSQKRIFSKKSKSGVDTLLSAGRVSHQYRATGCGTVIISYKNPQHDTLLLIPVNPLNEFDKDGMDVVFNFRFLKIHQPKGCKEGMPVQITAIKEKNIEPF